MEAIYGAAGTVLVGLLALLGTRTVAKVQRQAVSNEARLQEVELDAQIREDLRVDYERMRAEREQTRLEINRVAAERDEALRQLARVERLYESLLASKEQQ